jgi:hypothetical protein
MPQRTIFRDWREEQAASRYPFSDRATLTSGDGLEIPRAMFVDASIYPIGVGPRAYISRIEVANREVTIRVGSAGNVDLASATFDPLAPTSEVLLADAFGRPAGMLVCDPVELAAAQTWTAGDHAFTPTGAEFAASCVIPLPARGVRGVLAGGRAMAGEVWLVGEAGVVVRPDDDEVRIDIVGDVLFARRLCDPRGLFRTPRLIRTIRVITEAGTDDILPDQFGNFNLTPGNHLADDTALRIRPTPPDGLVIEVIGKRLGG